MEYVFGTIRREGRSARALKTVGSYHTNFSGVCHVERNYTDNIITDDFTVVEKYKSVEENGLCYDWYEIKEHSRYIDRFSPAQEAIDTNINDTQDAIVEIAEMVSEQNDALMELASLMEV